MGSKLGEAWQLVKNTGAEWWNDNAFRLAAALARIHATAPDLVLMDVGLPGSDGVTITEQLKSSPELASIPVVMVTTRGTVSDRAMAASLGADALIVKSEFENAHLLETVKRFVEIGA